MFDFFRSKLTQRFSYEDHKKLRDLFHHLTYLDKITEMALHPEKDTACLTNLMKAFIDVYKNLKNQITETRIHNVDTVRIDNIVSFKRWLAESNTTLEDIIQFPTPVIQILKEAYNFIVVDGESKCTSKSYVQLLSNMTTLNSTIKGIGEITNSNLAIYGLGNHPDVDNEYISTLAEFMKCVEDCLELLETLGKYLNQDRSYLNYYANVISKRVKKATKYKIKINFTKGKTK